MFESILVPVDGSPFSEQALPLALGMAQKNGATVHVALVHVLETEVELSASCSDEMERPIKRHEREYLDGLKTRLSAASSVQVQVHHLEGLVSETLEEEVRERGIQLVVMSTHGWGYMSRAILGSVADRLMRHLTVPLLLVHPPPGPADLSRPTSFQRLLIPLDGSSVAEAVLEPARALAQLFQAECHLLRVVVPPHHFLARFSNKTLQHDQHLLSLHQQEAAGYLEKVAGTFQQQALAATTHVRTNPHIVPVILEEAKTASCDLIALATHGWGGLRRLVFGSVADKVLRSAPLPVLVRHAVSC